MQNCNHQIKDINTYILYVLYFLINALFITKYLMRISLSVTLLALSAYLIIGLLLPRLAARIQHVGSLCFAILGFILVLAGMQYFIDPYQIQVDRWSAIHNFINYLVHGRYPYMAPTHLGGYGSPFPVWQVLHIPFYYLNNVGLSLLRSWPSRYIPSNVCMATGQRSVSWRVCSILLPFYTRYSSGAT